MAKYIKIENLCWMLFLTILTTSTTFAQRDVEKWKAQLAVGINNPIDKIKNDGFYTKYINFPTLSIGVQHMFSENWGAKLDLNYARSSNAESSLEFKLNYTRINAQAVYDFKDLINFLPDRVGLVGHAGPGVSMTKPLGEYVNNTYTYINLLAGLEIHYRVAESYSFYIDGSYSFSPFFNQKYYPETDGFSFHGDIMYIMVGVSISLSGCHYC